MPDSCIQTDKPFWLNVFNKIQTHEQRNLERIVIDVPQGCYAEINEFTPSNVEALLTINLNICTCIIVTDPEHKNIILSHVDGNHTNLLDPDHGLKSWIDKIPGENVEIQIHVGIKKLQTKEQSNDYNEIYKSQIETVKSLLPDKNIKIIDYTDEINKNVETDYTFTTGALIIRNKESKPLFGTLDTKLLNSKINGECIDDIRKEFNRTKHAMEEDFFNTRNLTLYNNNKESFAEKEILEQENLLCQLTYKVYGQEVPKIINNMPLPPICCYDGYGQPKESKNIQQELNTNNGKIIDEYAKQLKSIYGQNKDLNNTEVLNKFKQKNVEILEERIENSKTKENEKSTQTKISIIRVM